MTLATSPPLTPRIPCQPRSDHAVLRVVRTEIDSPEVSRGIVLLQDLLHRNHERFRRLQSCRVSIPGALSHPDFQIVILAQVGILCLGVDSRRGGNGSPPHSRFRQSTGLEARVGDVSRTLRLLCTTETPVPHRNTSEIRSRWRYHHPSDTDRTAVRFHRSDA
jgi:hypothetical protein